MKFNILRGTADINVSSWAGYIAQDMDGKWFEYEEIPEFMPDTGMWESGGRMGFLVEGVSENLAVNELYEVIR